MGCRNAETWFGYVLRQADLCRSRGHVALRSDDPYDAPKLDIGYLTDSEGTDLATLRCASQIRAA